MKHVARLVGFACALVLGGCGGAGGLALDGGQSGTGIRFTVVSGQVSGLSGSMPTGDVEGIDVRIADTDLATTTDATGLFRLEGPLSGRARLLFERPEDAVRAELDVVLPSGGRLDLPGVVLDPETGAAEPADEQIDFIGLIDEISCDENWIFVVSAFDPDGFEFEVDLTGAIIIDENEVPLTCADFEIDDLFDIEASVTPDDVLTNAWLQRVLEEELNEDGEFIDEEEDEDDPGEDPDDPGDDPEDPEDPDDPEDDPDDPEHDPEDPDDSGDDPDDPEDPDDPDDPEDDLDDPEDPDDSEDDPEDSEDLDDPDDPEDDPDDPEAAND